MRAISIVAGLLLIGAPAAATEVVARISGVVGSAGVVRVSVCAREEYPTRVCHLNGQALARPGMVEVRVPNVPPGRWVVIAHHDRSGDGVVHTDWLGVPTDGVGVSRNVEGAFGPPEFAQVALDLAGKTVVVSIALRREPGT